MEKRLTRISKRISDWQEALLFRNPRALTAILHTSAIILGCFPFTMRSILTPSIFSNESLVGATLLCIFVSAWFGGFGTGLVTTTVAIAFSIISTSLPAHELIPFSLSLFLQFGGGAMMSYLLQKRNLIAEGFRKRELHLRALHEEKEKLLDKEKNAREVAENAVRERDEFLAIASHELKTPLTSIVLQLQSTLRRILTQTLADFSGEKLVKSLKVAEQQSDRLSNLIKDLLNVSLISSGKMDLQMKEGDLTEIISALSDRLGEQMEQSGCQFRFHSNGMIDGMWDGVRIEQAVSNLLTNAMKYGKGKPVDVTVKKRDDLAIISVRDHGIGIPEKYHDFIFERFKRAVSENEYKGLGVGLFIVRQIVHAHGGEVEIESAQGRGTTFTINLPIHKPPKDS